MSEEPLCVVYQAVNTVNGKRYIGMTSKGMAWRRRGHKAQANAGYNYVIACAIRKYGFDQFEFSVLEVCADVPTALRRERELIIELRPEYNTAAGGRSGPQGWKHSEESRARMRASHIGQPGPWRGKKRSSESIAKRTATRALNPVRYWLGKERSLETVAKIRATRRRKPVRCVNDGLTFDAVRWAAKHYRIDLGSLSKNLRGRVKTVGGLQFEYVR